MAIEVDLLSLKRFWYLPGGHLRFLVKVDFGTAMPELDELLEIAAGIRHRLASAGGANHVDAEGWVRTKAGWSGVLVNAYAIDDGLEWLDLFVATWASAFQGKIIGGPRSTAPKLMDSGPVPTAFVAYTTGDLSKVPSDDRGPLWYVEDKITRYIAERAIAWSYRPGCEQYLMREDWQWWVQADGIDHAAAMAQGMDRYASVQFTCSESAPERLRHMKSRAHGRVCYQMVDPSASWLEIVNATRGTLRWTPPHTDLGFVRFDTANSPLWNSWVLPWPHVSEPDVRYNRPLLASFVPDANGIQLLTEAHLERARDLSSWKVEKLGGGRYLVEWPELDAWYAQVEPDPGGSRQGAGRFWRDDPDA